jgi:beta-mannosidase
MKNQSLAGEWEFRQKGESDWLPANVPGGVHTDLLALGKILDPFVGDNERRVRWVAENDWEYCHRFIASDEVLAQPYVELVCDGLDTLAVVWLNGVELGSTTNMFRQYRWDVKSILQTGENVLQITFMSPVHFVTAQQAVRPLPGVAQAIPGGSYLRKAPCQFGWDWGPQLPPIGIWKDIRLEGYQNARIEEVHLRQYHRNDQVMIEAEVTIQNWVNVPYQIGLHLVAPDGKIFEAQTKITNEKSCKLQVKIENPQLWWPNGYGSQPLYQVRVELCRSKSILDQREYQVGLRTVELRQQPDEWGRSFTFVVNGLPIYAKGSNWIPADSFPTRITKNDLERLIKAAADTHQNMLRVWGGGFYEDDRFYDLCDRYGILVWQEFIFACSGYPLYDADFVENIRNEVVQNVHRLRHHASLAIWCGNNEMEWGWVEWGWKTAEYHDLKTSYDRFFHHTLPEWCAREDPDRPYWPSSPSSNTPFENPNGQQQGDAHYWDVWHGRKPFSAYRSQFPRFMSEFGFQSLPPLATIRAYAAEQDWNIASYVMEQHQKNPNGNALMVSQMLDSHRLPKDFESLVYLSMVLQAEGIRYGVEHWRRHPKQVSGILYWQFNDCWPVASWSSVDYFGRWKALHYAARRFFAPLLLSIEDQQKAMNVVLTNDSPENWEGMLRWSLETLAGEVLQSKEEQVNAAPLDATCVCRCEFSNSLKDEQIRNMVFVAELLRGERILSRQAAFFVPIKYLNLVDPHIQSQIQIEDQQVKISLASHSFAGQVECMLEGSDAVFSDNYFDLPAGRVVEISAPLPSGWTKSQVKNAFQVRSIYDSYEHKKRKS